MAIPSKLLVLGAVWILAILAGVPRVTAQTTWTLRASGSVSPLSGVARGGGKWVAVGDGGTILVSADSVVWSAATSGTALTLRSVVWGGQQFVVVGQNGTILTSPDGLAWTPRTSGVTIFLSGIAHDGNRFVAVGGSGTVLTSTDGVVWAPSVSSSFRFLQSVAFGGGRFVAVGSSGAILTSPDGLAWSAGSSGVAVSLSGVGWFKGKFLAVGQNGKILSSVNGQAWTSVLSGTLAFLRTVASEEESAVVAGEDGTLLVSSDGNTWTPAVSGVTDYLNGATFADGIYCAVGDLRSVAPGRAIILTSPVPLSLSTALDGRCLTWSSGGTLPWQTQTSVTSDGIDAGVSGAGLPAGGTSFVETVVEGPATVGFSWKISAGAGDTLGLAIDGAPALLVSGEQDWASSGVLLGSGVHSLRWTFTRGPDAPAGQNLAWLDAVEGRYAYADWAPAHFDSGELADTAISGPLADVDGDDLANLLEYVFDANPTIAREPSTAIPQFEVVAGPHAAFVYRRHVKRLEGVTVRIEGSDDLADWAPLASTEEVLSTVGMIETVRITAAEVFGLPERKFYQLSVTSAP